MPHRISEETRDRASTSETARDVACPECRGSLVQDETHGETVCTDCGLIVTEDVLDRGPEWRAFDAGEREEKSRVGAPRTQLLHDKGLTTTIDWKDEDASGRALSPDQRRKIARLRTWNERVRVRNASEDNLREALGELKRMAAALDLPAPVQERASVIYQRALDEGVLPGRSIEGVATATLYVAARQTGMPRSLDDVARVSRVAKRRIGQTYRYLSRQLDLEVKPVDPVSYLPRLASELGVSSECERRARELLEAGKEQGLHSGRSPVGLAAAAIYAGGLLTNAEFSQSEVGGVAHVAEATIRDHYPELLDAAGYGRPSA